MFGRKTGFLAAVVMALALFSGCGTDGRVDEAKARNWYNNRVTNGTTNKGGNNYWDGYGVNNGVTTDRNNTERNTYGMRTDNGNTLGQDVRNAWDNVKNDVKNMGNGNNR